MDRLLLNLIDLIRNHINDQNVSKVLTSSTELDLKLDDESKKIQTEMQRKIYNLNDDKTESATFVKYILRELFTLSNELRENYVSDQSINAVINKLIDFLRTEYDVYLNPQTKLPDLYLKSKASDLESLVATCNHQLRQYVPKSAIADIIEDYLLQNGYMIRTFAELNYYIYFTEKLQLIFSKKTNEPVETRLIEELFHINFNAHSFISYCSAVFDNHMTLKSSKLRAEDVNYQRLIRIAKMPQHESLSFDPTDKDLKTVFIELVETELRKDSDGKRNAADGSYNVGNVPFVTANMNTPVMMVIADGAITAEVASCDRYIDLYTWIANNIKTKNKPGSLSPRAMKNRKNDADADDAREAVKHLQSIINVINKKYKI